MHCEVNCTVLFSIGRSYSSSNLGTTVDQDGRWGKSDEILISKMSKAGKFASILDTKVDLKKINIPIIEKWVFERVTDILGFEDEIIINLVINLLHNDVSKIII
jgi:serine/arginine repetitive matrix protein 1